MNQSLILQVINAELAILAFCSLVIFVHYIYQNIQLGYDFLRAALAITAVCLGDVLLRAPLWYTRQLVNMGGSAQTPDDWIILGGIVSTLGFICIIRVFSPRRWGHKSWVSALLLTVVLTTLSVLYTFWRMCC